MPKRSRKQAWSALPDARHRHSESGLAVFTSLATDDPATPIRLRFFLEHEPDRMIVARLEEGEALKMADDVRELLAVRVKA